MRVVNLPALAKDKIRTHWGIDFSSSVTIHSSFLHLNFEKVLNGNKFNVLIPSTVVRDSTPLVFEKSDFGSILISGESVFYRYKISIHKVKNTKNGKVFKGIPKYSPELVLSGITEFGMSVFKVGRR